MSKTTKEIILWLSAASAALDAVTVAILGAPGDFVGQETLFVLLAVGAGLSAFVAFMARDREPPV